MCNLSLMNDMKAGAASVQIIAWDPSVGHISMHCLMKAVLRVFETFIFHLRQVVVYDVTHALITTMHCCSHLRTSATKVVPGASGSGDVSRLMTF